VKHIVHLHIGGG